MTDFAQKAWCAISLFSSGALAAITCLALWDHDMSTAVTLGAIAGFAALMGIAFLSD